MYRTKHSNKRPRLGTPAALQAEATWRSTDTARRFEEHEEERLKIIIKLNQLEAQEAHAHRAYVAAVDYTDDEQCSIHSVTWRNLSGKTPSLDPSTVRFETSSDGS